MAGDVIDKTRVVVLLSPPHNNSKGYVRGAAPCVALWLMIFAPQYFELVQIPYAWELVGANTFFKR